MSINWEPLRSIIDSNERFILSSHVRPDADALGSELALAKLLENQGRSVQIVNPSATPANLEFLVPEGRVFKMGDGFTKEEVFDTDVHIIVDTSAWKQLNDVGRVFKESEAVKVVIDHHASADDLGAIEFKDPTSEATGALIFQMAEALGYELDFDMANALFCAIATDTGWFRFPSTTASTMHIIGRLVELGAVPHQLYHNLYEQSTLSRVRLAGCALNRVELQCEGQLAYTVVEWDDFVQTGARPVDTENLVNECMRIAGVKAAFIAVQQLNSQVKFSLRSRPGIDVSKVAEVFGGGGHKQASGTVLSEPLKKAVDKVLVEMGKLFPESGE